MRPEGFPVDWQNRQTYLCGFVHSGIPACCVVFFHDVWLPFVAMTTAFARDPTFVSASAIARAYGYVPCPKCIRSQRLIKLRGCSCRRLNSTS